jgi:hypothetical protein
MKLYRLLGLSLLISFVVAAFSLAATVPGQDFPYARIQLRTPPLELSFPGFGSYYSTIFKGAETLMWNPALLSKTEHVDSSLSLVSDSALSDYNYKYNTDDRSEKLGDFGNINTSIFFTGDRSVTGAATREHTAHTIYSTKGTGLNFAQALKVNDWLSFGFISRSDAGAAIDTSGNFGAITRFDASFTNSTLNFGNTLTVGIDNAGFATATITPEAGITYTQRLEQKVWSGFLNQRSDVPYTAVLETRNDVAVSAPLTMGGAAKWRDLAVGLSLTPVSANCNINNSARAVVNDGTPDMVFYQPNFDPNNEQSMLNWMQDPNQYGSEVGYKRNTIHVPAGEVVGEARYKGFYQASAARMDLGATYDIGEILTVGLAFENMGGAALDFRGTGRVSYVNSRFGTLEAPSIDPTKEFTWNPFQDTFSTVEGTEKYYLEEQLKAELPRKMRFGLALHKPFLIAIDYEQNSAPINVKYEDKNTKQTKIGTVSNINMIRVGLESQVFALPWWTRGSIILMLKPSLSNFEQDTQDSVDKAFKYGALPLGLELGNEFNLWGVILGDAIGFNVTPLISMAQLDTTNLDLNKIIYYDIFVGHGPWRVSYLAAFDPGATGSAYANREDKTKKIENPSDAMSYLRFIQTLKVSYSF